jgi:hypothetical protein
MSQADSISIRLRRTTTEVAYISVPITEELLVSDVRDVAVSKLDVNKLLTAALELGAQPSTIWRLEGEKVIDLHPIQQAPADSSAP